MKTNKKNARNYKTENLTGLKALKSLTLYEKYRKIPKISPGGLYFSKALFKGPIFGGTYLRREICVSKSIGLAL